ncbi:MAG: NUDIX domain-containing protein [Verrucomicrobiota bacterium]|nr:NUDIX domain-containing protein [Verrucomicrobiota bacterium]
MTTYLSDIPNKVESVTGLLFSPDRTQVLLVERCDVPVWVLPGGGVESGETPEEALMREMEEETGLVVQIDRCVGRYLPISRLAKITHLYECTMVSGNLRRSEETQDVCFFPLQALPKLIPPPYPEWIQEGYAQGPFIERELSSINYRTLLKTAVQHPLLVAQFLFTRLFK